MWLADNDNYHKMISETAFLYVSENHRIFKEIDLLLCRTPVEKNLGGKLSWQKERIAELSAYYPIGFR